jgi:hypothetical protein
MRRERGGGEGKVRRSMREGKGEVCEGNEVDREGKGRRCIREVKGEICTGSKVD